MPLEWKRNSEPDSHFCCQVPLLASYQAAVCIGHLSACEVLEVNCKMKIGQVHWADFLFHHKYRNAICMKPVDKALRNWPS